MTAEELVLEYRVAICEEARRIHQQENADLTTRLDTGLAMLGLKFNWLHSPQPISRFVKENVKDKKQRVLLLRWVKELRQVDAYLSDSLGTVRRIQEEAVDRLVEGEYGKDE